MQIRDVLKDAEVMKLCKSYRSSYEITSFAQKISKSEDLQAIERHGEEPVIKPFKKGDEELAFLKRVVAEHIGQATSIGFICKTEKEAVKLHQQLSEETDQVCLLSSESAAFTNGIIVTTAHTVKGLEFHEIVVPYVNEKQYHTEMDRSLLYIACTRAMHKLTLTAAGEISHFIH
jgi:DNA helicase-2/ATP-dependent DNA helicase PcrA